MASFYMSTNFSNPNSAVFEPRNLSDSCNESMMESEIIDSNKENLELDTGSGKLTETETKDLDPFTYNENPTVIDDFVVAAVEIADIEKVEEQQEYKVTDQIEGTVKEIDTRVSEPSFIDGSSAYQAIEDSAGSSAELKSESREAVQSIQEAFEAIKEEYIEANNFAEIAKLEFDSPELIGELESLVLQKVDEVVLFDNETFCSTLGQAKENVVTKAHDLLDKSSLLGSYMVSCNLADPDASVTRSCSQKFEQDETMREKDLSEQPSDEMVESTVVESQDKLGRKVVKELLQNGEKVSIDIVPLCVEAETIEQRKLDEISIAQDENSVKEFVFQEVILGEINEEEEEEPVDDAEICKINQKAISEKTEEVATEAEQDIRAEGLFSLESKTEMVESGYEKIVNAMPQLEIIVEDSTFEKVESHVESFQPAFGTMREVSVVGKVDFNNAYPVAVAEDKLEIRNASNDLEKDTVPSSGPKKSVSVTGSIDHDSIEPCAVSENPREMSKIEKENKLNLGGFFRLFSSFFRDFFRVFTRKTK